MVTLASGSLALLTGCGTYPDEHIVSAPPPTVVTAPATQQVVVQQPSAGMVTATPLANGQLLITQAPPAVPQAAVVVAARPARPSSSHVWVDGHWTWRNDRYEWIEARWQQQPYANAEWVSPRWERRPDGHYTFYEGYWN
jgi:hypothetical protein